jgi:methyl-accepting chemotaxis protein
MQSTQTQDSKKILSVHDFVPEAEQLDAFKEKVFSKIDRSMDYLIFVQFLSGFFIAYYTQTWYTAVGMGVISLAIYCTFRFLFTGLSSFRYLTSALVTLFIVQYLLQLNGLLSLHRLFAISLTVLLFYQNWRILLPSFLVSITYMIISLYAIANPDISFRAYFTDISDYDTARIVTYILFHCIQFVFCLVIAIQLERRFSTGIRNIIYIKEQLNLEANIQLANQIAAGNFEADYEHKKNDYMGETLLSMRENLKNYREQENRNHWINEGIAQISQVLMQHNDMRLLAEQTLLNVIKYVKASQGLLFLVKYNDKQNKNFLMLTACYAYQKEGELGQEIEIGDDLVGEVVMRKKTIHLKELPENYITIASGLGGAKPAEVVLVPLKVQEEVIGVIEIGTFSKVRNREIEFLEKIGERIATSLLSVQANQRNNDLLQESQLLAEQMQKQEDILRKNMQELQNTQKAMSEANDKLNRLLLNVPGMIFTQRKQDGVWSINFVSAGAKNLIGYEPQEVINGKVHFSDLIHPEDLKTTYQEADKMVAEALANKTVYEIRYRIVDAYKNIKWVWEKGNGLYDEKGQLVGLQGFVTDITAQVQATQQVNEQLEEMQAQEDVIRTTMDEVEFMRKTMEDKNTELQNTLKAIDEVLVILELSPDRKVQYVNHKFTEISQYTPEEVLGKDLSFYALPEDLANGAVDTLWEQLISGQPTAREVRRIKKDGTIFWMQAYYIPTIDAKGNLVKITSMSTDITAQKNKEAEVDKLLRELGSRIN